MFDTGYRTGKITNRKSEYLCQFSNASRSTGYFGTGYYFCTQPEHCITLTRENNELYELKFKKDLNWLLGTVKKHEALKHITQFVKCFDFVRDSAKLEKLCKILRRLNKYVYEFPEGKETSIVDYIKSTYESDKEFELCSNFKSFLEASSNRDYRDFISGLLEIEETKPFAELLLSEDFSSAKDFIEKHAHYFSYAYVDSMRNLYEDTVFEVFLNFGTSEEDFLVWSESANVYLNAHLEDYVDSISTKFLKSFGYEGVWPSKECDNTTYGGVVFDKENIESIKLLSTKAKDY